MRLPDESADDALFRALADASRRALLDRLHAAPGLTLTELADGRAMSRQAVAKHLAALEAADLVATRREGRVKRHFLNPVPIAAIARRWMTKFETARADALLDLKDRLETSAGE